MSRRCSGSATSSRRGRTGSPRQGRNGRKGLRTFSVSGRVKKPGRQAGAGRHHRARADRRVLRRHGRRPPFKGYLPGGASGGILPASMADIPLDFGTLEQHGCFVGCHAVVVLSDQDDMKDAALNLMRFFEDESCGQCTPCRVGTEKAVKLMDAGAGTRRCSTSCRRSMARRLDLRPRPGGAESAEVRVQVFPGGARPRRARRSCGTTSDDPECAAYRHASQPAILQDPGAAAARRGRGDHHARQARSEARCGSVIARAEADVKRATSCWLIVPSGALRRRCRLDTRRALSIGSTAAMPMSGSYAMSLDAAARR